MSIQITAKASIIELDDKKLLVFQIDEATNAIIEKVYGIISEFISSDKPHIFVCSERWQTYIIDADDIRVVATPEKKKKHWWRKT